MKLEEKRRNKEMKERSNKRGYQIRTKKKEGREEWRESNTERKEKEKITYIKRE